MALCIIHHCYCAHMKSTPKHDKQNTRTLMYSQPPVITRQSVCSIVIKNKKRTATRNRLRDLAVYSMAVHVQVQYTLSCKHSEEGIKKSTEAACCLYHFIRGRCRACRPLQCDTPTSFLNLCGSTYMHVIREAYRTRISFN